MLLYRCWLLLAIDDRYACMMERVSERKTTVYSCLLHCNCK
jgi:hypothetical protein